MSFVEELNWRGLMYDTIHGTEDHLKSAVRSGYIGFDPSAPSLHVGNLVQIMLLTFFQRAGHKPIALVGGATGMIGDPSGKSEERNLLDEGTIRNYELKIKSQLSKFLDFESRTNAATIENNYDWFKDFGLLDFLRQVGKHLTINYMMAKDSVKGRLESGMSYTEFTYQLLQGYDFFWLNKNRNCTMQMGGSDQWGNITAGVELTRRISGNEVFAVTSPLVTRADGKKFGKTEEGAIWLDRSMTSPFRFYQFWLNISDEDAPKYIRYFSLMNKDQIEGLEKEHALAPHKRILQQTLAEEITTRIHSKEDLDHAIKASRILFGQSTANDLTSLNDYSFNEIFEGVPTKTINRSVLDSGVNVVQLFADETQFFPSRNEARRTIQSNGASINKQPVSAEQMIKSDSLIHNRYLLLQKGKKNYFLVIVE